MKLYARAAQALIMVGVVHVYGELARRFGRMKLLALVLLFFISNLVLLAFLAEMRLHFGLAFFLYDARDVIEEERKEGVICLETRFEHR